MADDPYIQKFRALKPRFKEMGLKRARVFGSRLRGDARPNSDLDLLLEFYEKPNLLELGALYTNLEEILGCPVHISQPHTIRPELRDAIIAEAKDV